MASVSGVIFLILLVISIAIWAMAYKEAVEERLEGNSWVGWTLLIGPLAIAVFFLGLRTSYVLCEQQQQQLSHPAGTAPQVSEAH